MPDVTAISSKLIYEQQKIRPFHILSLIFIFIFVLSNISATKMTHLFGQNIFSGIVYFPFIYILNDIITEIYGFKASRKIIWIAAVMNILCAILLYLAVLMPNAPDIETNPHFNKVFHLSAVILFVSSVSFVLGEYINALILAKSKVKFNGKFFAFRAVFSTLIGCVIETFLFISIVFYYTKSETSIFELALTLISIKIVYEIIFMPITSIIVKHLKDVEHLDFYDYKTKFKLFSF